VNTPVKLFSCTQSETLSKQIAKQFGQDLGSVYFQRYSDGEFQPSFEESVRGSRVFFNWINKSFIRQFNGDAFNARCC